MANINAYSISTIEKAPASCGGGLYINGSIYVDAGYSVNINWSENLLTISSPRSEDEYVGNIDAISIDGKSKPRNIGEIINWLKPGHADQGGDDGFSVAITFNPDQFTGDGSDIHPVTIRPGAVEANVIHTDKFDGNGTTATPLDLIKLTSSLIIDRLNPDQFYIDMNGLISYKGDSPGPTPGDIVYAQRFIIHDDPLYPVITAKRFVLTNDTSYPVVEAYKLVCSQTI